MTVTAGLIVEAIDVIGHIVQRQLAVFVDLLLDPFFFKLLKKDSGLPQIQEDARRAVDTLTRGERPTDQAEQPGILLAPVRDRGA